MPRGNWMKANTRPPGWKVWENAPLLPGGGGWGAWALLELTDALNQEHSTERLIQCIRML